MISTQTVPFLTQEQYLESSALLRRGANIEVLSPSTKNYDQGEKFRYYRALPSFREYLLLAQDEIRAEHHVRQPDGAWLMREYSTATDVIPLDSIGSASVWPTSMSASSSKQRAEQNEKS